ncbi:MAG: methyltransferase domain-containing protein, partial [Candidatus Diapherotrites archaeon]
MKKKFSVKKIFWHNREALEQATPEQIALYRASRLKCETAIDLCCGIGIDAIALAKYCKKVYAVDKDSDALRCAEKNAKCYGIKNIKFINADCFSLDLKKLGVEVAFADPSRRAFGKRVKDLNETQPSTIALVKFIKSFEVKNFCIEVSRELRPQDIPFECEVEYISLNNELNCASLYFGSIAANKRSAVVLPSQEKVSSNVLFGKKLETCHAPKTFLYELDECIVRSGLQFELIEKLQCEVEIFSDNYLTSDKLIKSNFFRNTFKALKQTDAGSLVKDLKALDAKKAVLHGRFVPEIYDALAKDINSKLSGQRKLHVL